jgi:orotidine-5'-phosphate decarboxylase
MPGRLARFIHDWSRLNESNAGRKSTAAAKTPPGVRADAAARQRQNGAGNAARNYERYLALAREATLNGDIVEAGNCYQYAEHYFRVMRERDG